MSTDNTVSIKGTIPVATQRVVSCSDPLLAAEQALHDVARNLGWMNAAHAQLNGEVVVEWHADSRGWSGRRVYKVSNGVLDPEPLSFVDTTPSLYGALG